VKLVKVQDHAGVAYWVNPEAVAYTSFGAIHFIGGGQILQLVMPIDDLARILVDAEKPA